MPQPQTMAEMLDEESRRAPPRTVLGAKLVDFALVTYTGEDGQRHTQLAVIGDKQVHLLDAKPMGFSETSTAQGLANAWLRDGIFEMLGRKVT